MRTYISHGEYLSNSLICRIYCDLYFPFCDNSLLFKINRVFFVKWFLLHSLMNVNFVNLSLFLCERKHWILNAPPGKENIEFWMHKMINIGWFKSLNSLILCEKKWTYLNVYMTFDFDLVCVKINCLCEFSLKCAILSGWVYI